MGPVLIPGEYKAVLVYFSVQADSPLSTPVLLAIELIVWGGLEYKRYEIYKKTG